MVTLPKITIPEQVSALADCSHSSKSKPDLPAGSLKMEMMIETTQSIINIEGQINLPLLLAAGEDVASRRTLALTTTPRVAASPPRTST